MHTHCGCPAPVLVASAAADRLVCSGGQAVSAFHLPRLNLRLPHTLTPQQDIDLSAFRHRIFLLPRVPACAWPGLGQQGCFRSSRCSTFINVPGEALKFSTVMHELGHNLGLMHSGVGEDEYGDHSCIM